VKNNKLQVMDKNQIAHPEHLKMGDGEPEQKLFKKLQKRSAKVSTL